MKPNDTIRRTSAWGDVVIRENITEQEVKNYLAMQKEGFDFEVLVDGEYKPVPKLMIHKARPEECESCSG